MMQIYSLIFTIPENKLPPITCRSEIKSPYYSCLWWEIYWNLLTDLQNHYHCWHPFLSASLNFIFRKLSKMLFGSHYGINNNGSTPLLTDRFLIVRLHYE